MDRNACVVMRQLMLRYRMCSEFHTEWGVVDRLTAQYNPLSDRLGRTDWAVLNVGRCQAC